MTLREQFEKETGMNSLTYVVNGYHQTLEYTEWLEKQNKQLVTGKKEPHKDATPVTPDEIKKISFTAKKLISIRQKLKLNKSEFAKLLKVTNQAVGS